MVDVNKQIRYYNESRDFGPVGFTRRILAPRPFGAGLWPFKLAPGEFVLPSDLKSTPYPL